MHSTALLARTDPRNTAATCRCHASQLASCFWQSWRDLGMGPRSVVEPAVGPKHSQGDFGLLPSGLDRFVGVEALDRFSLSKPARSGQLRRLVPG
jgi:hypothetical protein